MTSGVYRYHSYLVKSVYAPHGRHGLPNNTKMRASVPAASIAAQRAVKQKTNRNSLAEASMKRVANIAALVRRGTGKPPIMPVDRHGGPCKIRLPPWTTKRILRLQKVVVLGGGSAGPPELLVVLAVTGYRYPLLWRFTARPPVTADVRSLSSSALPACTDQAAANAVANAVLIPAAVDSGVPLVLEESSHGLSSYVEARTSIRGCGSSCRHSAANNLKGVATSNST